jgi:hypothetical protein
MTSRFLSFVAALGLLAAAGCSGGGAGSALGGLSSGGGVTPSAPTSAGGSGSTASHASTPSNASFTTSFQIPVAGNLSTQSQGRSPLYVSPGSTGLQVVLSANGTASTGAGASGSAQLSGPLTLTVGSNYVATNSISVSLIPGSSSVTPVVGQLFTVNFLPTNGSYLAVPPNPAPGSQSGTFIVDSLAANNTVLTAHQVSATGSALTLATANYGTAGAPPAGTGTANVTETYPAGSILTFQGSSSASFVVGTATQPAAIIPGTSGTVSIPASVYGAGPNASYTYSFSSPNGGLGNASGYITGTLTFNGMLASTNFVVGIVLTDTSNSNNYILSEGQSTVFTTAASGQTAVNLTLNPVVANVYIPPPVNLTAATAGVFAANSFETTVFATDERGWVIPSITYANGNALPFPSGGTANVTDNAAEFVITPAVAGSLTFNVAAYNQLPVASLQTAPTAGAVTNGLATLNIGLANGAFAPQNASYANPLGTFITNPKVPTGPFTLPLNTPGTPPVPTATNANGVGNPLNIACAVSTANVGLKVQLVSTTPAAGAAPAGPAQLPVAGVVYNPGVNYPAAGATTIPAGSNIATVNCTPSFGITVN